MYEMKNESTKYERITDILKKSEPVLTGSETIEENVMATIRKKSSTTESFAFLDSLFGWVYIGWVRSGLVAASILIISVFVVQQSMLLKRINSLERQATITSPSFVRGVPDDFESAFMIYKQSGRISLKECKLSDKQLKQLEKSINDLQTSYRNLIKLVEDNPELKQYVENILSENEKKKINL
jgi:hypothetical protein